MSLLVNAYTRDSEGQMVLLTPADRSEELAGFEAFRMTFYGGQAARSLGLRLLPTLAERDLYAEGEELECLRNEAAQVLENIGQFAEEAGADRELLQRRVQNIVAAVRRAQQAQGGVVIW